MPVLEKKRMHSAGAVSGLAWVVACCAQSVSADVTELDSVVVTGSRIASGAKAALPVTMYGTEELAALGVVSGDDLMRSLPQLGDATWHATWLAGGASSNAARGDVGSINLKHLGASNTLVLINGRRSVVHSTMSTVDGGVSNFTYNSNAIPMFGVESLDILRDGAAAVYGSDAVSGVVNFTTLRNLDGEGAFNVQYGATASNPSDLELSGYWGSNFADGRGNVTISVGVNRHSAIGVKDNWYTRTNDRRSFFPRHAAGGCRKS
jgi:iron complex outermembrane recepter protein